MRRGAGCLLILILLVSGCFRPESTRGAGRPGVLRLGYLANLTHAQAILGVEDGTLEQATGVRIETRVFTAGPAAIMALLAGELDMLYVGPSPAVAGYIRSEGRALRIIAGSASGGAVFVTRRGFDPDRLEGARLATPGLANTQDIALRHLLAERGLRTREQGGSVQIVPLAPVDLLLLFRRGEIDGGWVAEPWGARLVQEADAEVAWDERDLWPRGQFATTVLVVATDYLSQNRETVRRFLKGHVELTRWIQRHPQEARARLQSGLGRLTGKVLPDDIIHDACDRIDFLFDPMEDSVHIQAERAFRLGYLGARPPELVRLFDLTLLQEVAP